MALGAVLQALWRSEGASLPESLLPASARGLYQGAPRRSHKIEDVHRVLAHSRSHLSTGVPS